jgi:nucleotide-binding universal stress UspA family protein
MATRIETVLVAVDGSTTDAATLGAGATLARRVDARLRLLHVAPSDRHDEMREALRAVTSSLGTPVDLELHEGDPSAVILAQADRDPGTVICMGDRGRSSLGDLLLGSVTEVVLSRSIVPVLVVGPRVAPGALALPAAPVVICVDDSSECEAVIEPAAGLARALEVPVSLVEVVAPEERVEIDDVPVADAPTTHGRHRLREVAVQVAGRGVEVTTHVLYGNDVAQAVAHHAHEASAAVIALATHGRTGMHRMLRGSTTHHLISLAPSPLLTVRCSD